MTDNYVKLRNDQGLAEIGIGVTEFKCAGASPPDGPAGEFIQRLSDPRQP